MSLIQRQIDDTADSQRQFNAAMQRTQELIRADQALRNLIVALAQDTDLSSFVGRVLITASEQLEAPVLEYWVHDSDTVARLIMSCREGRVFSGSDFANDPRVSGITIPVSMTGVDSLFKLRGHFISDLANDPEQSAVFDPLGLDLRAWCVERNVTTHLNVQLRFGDRSLGSLVAYFRSAEMLTDARIELACALANQITLAIRLTELAETAKQAALAREREIEADDRAKEASRISDFLSATIGKMSEGSDLRLTIESIIGGLAQELGAAHVFLFRHDPATKLIRLEISCLEGKFRRGLSGVELPLWAAPFPDDITPAWQIMVEMRGLFTPETTPIPAKEFGWPGAYEYASRIGLSDMGHIVLFAGDVPVGSIGFSLTDGRKLKPTDHSFIEGVAKQAALAIRMLDLAEQAKRTAVEETRRKAAQEQAAARLQELTHANSAMRRCLDGIGSAQDLDHLPSVVLGSFVDVFGASTGSLWSFDETDGSVTFQLEALDGKFISSTQSGLAHAQRHYFLPAHAPSYQKHMRLIAGETLTLDVETSDMFDLNEREHLRQNGIVTLIVIPLSAAGRHLGRLALAFDRVRSLSPAESEIASALATQASLVVEMTRLAETSKRLAVSREQERATTEERSRLAREIHDTLAQSFSGIIVQLRAMQRSSPEVQDATVRQLHAENALELASIGLAEARRSLASLRVRELEGRSLREALTFMAESTTKRSGIPIRVEAAQDLDFGVENEPELLRIAQESVTNAVRHSGASHIVIALRREGNRYDLCIEDNGRGFDKEKATEGFGLIGIQERVARIGATLSIETTDAGTAVCVHLARGEQNVS